MYGQAHTDLIVKYYDESFGIGSEQELAWYLNKAKRFGSPVLDLACGTGRLAFQLAQMGLEVVGLDQSEGMIHRFEQKLEQQPGAITDLIRVEQQSMSSFRVDQRFNTILCCDAFFHNLTVDDQIACLHAVRDHLAPEGRFVFNLPKPTCSFIEHAEQSNGQSFSKRGTYPLQDGGRLEVEHAQSGNRLEQLIMTTHRLSRFDHSNTLVEQGESTWQTRYLYHYEAIHLIHRCGLEVESLVGNYSDDPVGTAGQLIFQVKKATQA